MVGIVTAQTARINVASVARAGDPSLPPGPCRVTMKFVDAAGDPVWECTQELQSGKTAFCDYVFEPPHQEIDRSQFRIAVTVDPSDTRSSQSERFCSSDGSIVPTLEIFDNETKRATLFVNPNVLR